MTTDRQRQDGPAPPGSVVAGVRGSDRDDRVIVYAAAEAARLGAGLHLVRVVEIDSAGWSIDTPIPFDLITQVDDTSEAQLADAVEVARATGVEVTSQLLAGTGSHELLRASAGAAEIVVGSARYGGGRRSFVGTTALSLVAHADCPVLVYADPCPDAAGVVVGVDGSSHSGAALDHALEAAARRGARLTVVVTWYVEVVDGMVVTTPGTPGWEQVERRYRALVEALLAPRAAAYPNVAVSVSVRRGPAAATLASAGAGAELLVLGTRGRGALAGTILGSVTRKVLEMAECPVALVHA